MAEPVWNHHNREHRAALGQIIAPLIVASRSRDFVDAARADDQLIAWVMSLKDISAPLLKAGVERLMARGVTWMPRPGDLREACCDIVDEQRAIVAKRALALQAECPHCRDSRGLRENEHGLMVRCDCAIAAAALMTQASAPLARPALPAAPEASE